MEDQETEKDGKLDAPMQNYTRPSKSNITTSIKNDIWGLAKKNNIAWNDALEFGIKFLVADGEGFDYPKTKLGLRVETILQRLSDVSQELSDLKEKFNVTETEIKEEVDNIFGEVKDEN